MSHLSDEAARSAQKRPAPSSASVPATPEPKRAKADDAPASSGSESTGQLSESRSSASGVESPIKEDKFSDGEMKELLAIDSLSLQFALHPCSDEFLGDLTKVQLNECLASSDNRKKLLRRLSVESIARLRQALPELRRGRASIALRPSVNFAVAAAFEQHLNAAMNELTPAVVDSTVSNPALALSDANLSPTHRLLMEIVAHHREFNGPQSPPSYYMNAVVIIQSSGFGKSHSASTIARKAVFSAYLCTRDPAINHGDAFPQGFEQAKLLLSFNESRWKLLVLLILAELLKFLNPTILPASASFAEAVAMWFEFLHGPQHHAMAVTKDSPLSALVQTVYEKTDQDLVSDAEKLKGVPEALLTALHARFGNYYKQPTKSSFPSFLFIVDEASFLADDGNGTANSTTPLMEFYRLFSHGHCLGGTCALTLDTNSSIKTLVPTDKHSNRVATGHGAKIFYRFDTLHRPALESQFTFPECLHWKTFFKPGRPLCSAAFAWSKVDSYMELMKFKVTQTKTNNRDRSVRELTVASATAIAAQLTPISPSPRSPVAMDLVAQSMGTAVSVTGEEEVEVIYNAEPALATAAHIQLGAFAHQIVKNIRHSFDNASVGRGTRGELAVLLLLLLASFLPFETNADPTGTSELVSHCTVQQFLEVLFPRLEHHQEFQSLVNNPSLLRGILTLRHFMASQTDASPQQLLLGLLLGAGFLTSRNAMGIDALFPFFAPVASDAASAPVDLAHLGIMSVQVKNWAGGVPPKKVAKGIEKMKQAVEFSDSGLPVDVPTVLIFLDLSIESPTQIRRPKLEVRSDPSGRGKLEITANYAALFSAAHRQRFAEFFQEIERLIPVATATTNEAAEVPWIHDLQWPAYFNPKYK